MPPLIGRFPPPWQPVPQMRPVSTGAVQLMTVLLVALVAGLVWRYTQPVRFDWWNDPLPANYFQVAQADFEQARSHLAAGRLGDSHAAFERATAHRNDAAERMPNGKPFAQWCGQWRDEYARAVSARSDELLRTVREEQPEMPVAAMLLSTYGTPEQGKAAQTALAQATARQQRQAREQKARSAYHVKFASAQRDSSDEYRRQRIIETLAKRLGVAAVDAGDLGDAAAIAGLGTIEVRAQRFVAEVQFQSSASGADPMRGYRSLSREAPTTVKPTIPVVLKLEVRVNSAPAAATTPTAKAAPALGWQGTHLFVAMMSPPQNDTMSSIHSLGNRMDAALWEDALKKLDAAEETQPQRWSLLETRLAAAGVQEEPERKSGE